MTTINLRNQTSIDHFETTDFNNFMAWSGAARRLQPLAANDNFPAITLLARARLRLGEEAEARALAARVESSKYRHPAHAGLANELARGGGHRPVLVQGELNMPARTRWKQSRIVARGRRIEVPVRIDAAGIHVEPVTEVPRRSANVDIVWIIETRGCTFTGNGIRIEHGDGSARLAHLLVRRDEHLLGLLRAQTAGAEKRIRAGPAAIRRTCCSSAAPTPTRTCRCCSR